MNPFDAAWALLKQWEGIDWGPQGHMENTDWNRSVTEDPWANVDWSRMYMGPDGKPYSHKTDPMMRDLYSEGGMERTINRLNSPSPISLRELYDRYLVQRQGDIPQRGRQAAGQYPFPESGAAQQFQQYDPYTGQQQGQY